MSSQESSNCSIGSPYATSRQCSSPCPTNGGKRFNPDGSSLRFEPFMDSNLQIETPDIVGVGGGAWIPPLVPLLDASRPHSSPILDFHLPKRLIIAARDKESLLEEVISLKTELNYQSRKFMAHRIQANTIETENRKLEKDLEELELLKADARRTGGTERLRTKLNGMKCRLEDLHMVCEEQRDELFNLRKDVRLTRTRELEVERNVFAEEVIRLLKYMKRLKACQNKLNCENKELANVRDRATLLEIANKRLESCLTAINKNLEKTKQETALFKRKALETATSNKVDEKKRKELEDQAAKLAAQLDMETTEKQKWVRKASQLEHEIRKLSKELKEAMAAKNAKLDLLTVTVPAKKGTGSPPSSGKKGSVSDKPKSPERPKSPKKVNNV